MSEIQVSTGELHNGSLTLNIASNDIGDVKDQLSIIPGSVGDAYDGQLKQALEGIIAGSDQMGARLQNRSVDLGNELFSRATGFEAANEAGKSAVLGASTSYINFIGTTRTLGFLSFLNNKLQEMAASIWNMGGLAFGGLLAHKTFVNTKPKMPTETSSDTSQKENLRGIVNAPVNENADPSDCVRFVKGQKVDWPGNVTNNKSGWASGARDENYNYGNEPKPGAIMVEAKSDDPKIGATIDNVDYGHVSYVKSVEYDNNGKIMSFTVVEGNWDSKTTMHKRDIDWPSSKWSPEVFIYGKK